MVVTTTVTTTTHSQQHSHLHSRPFKTRFVLLFLAIVLPIASVFGDVFDLKLCDFGGFNDDLNVLNNEYEWEESLNNNEYCFDCDVLSSSTNNMMDTSGVTYALVFNYGPTGVGLAVNNEIGFDVVDTLTTTTIPADIDENKLLLYPGALRYKQSNPVGKPRSKSPKKRKGQKQQRKAYKKKGKKESGDNDNDTQSTQISAGLLDRVAGGDNSNVCKKKYISFFFLFFFCLSLHNCCFIL